MFIYGHIPLNSSWKRNISRKICRENPNIYFVFNNFFSPENRSFNEIMCKNAVEEPEGPQIQRMRFACSSVTKVTDTPSEYFCFFHNKSVYANVPRYYVMRNYSTFVDDLNALFPVILACKLRLIC
jgi:hypothetical protein